MGDCCESGAGLSLRQKQKRLWGKAGIGKEKEAERLRPHSGRNVGPPNRGPGEGSGWRVISKEGEILKSF